MDEPSAVPALLLFLLCAGTGTISFASFIFKAFEKVERLSWQATHPEDDAYKHTRVPSVRKEIIYQAEGLVIIFSGVAVGYLWYRYGVSAGFLTFLATLPPARLYFWNELRAVRLATPDPPSPGS